MALEQHEIDALRNAPVARGRNFINGDWRESQGGGEIEVRDGADGGQPQPALRGMGSVTWAMSRASASGLW